MRVEHAAVGEVGGTRHAELPATHAAGVHRGREANRATAQRDRQGPRRGGPDYVSSETKLRRSLACGREEHPGIPHGPYAGPPPAREHRMGTQDGMASP